MIRKKNKNRLTLEEYVILVKGKLLKTSVLKVRDFPELVKYERRLRQRLGEAKMSLPVPTVKGVLWEEGIPYEEIVKKEKFWLKELGGRGFAYFWKRRLFFFGEFPDTPKIIFDFYKALKKRGYLKKPLLKISQILGDKGI